MAGWLANLIMMQGRQSSSSAAVGLAPYSSSSTATTAHVSGGAVFAPNKEVQELFILL
jgi:hypothetical protein